jgi:aminoglycoside phosphotransferase (APT) family kinase protein
LASTDKSAALCGAVVLGQANGMEAQERERLAAWLRTAGIADGPVAAVETLSGGTQNILYRFAVGADRFVLRRPARNARPGAAQTIRREGRVIAALSGTAVPHARFRGLCDDPDVLGTVFLLTDAVPGFNAAVGMSPQAATDPAVRHGMGLAMVDGIVALAAVDHAAQGLADFGRLGDFIDRQVGRWASQLEDYRTLAGWPGPDGLGDVHAVGAWLDAHKPADWHGGLMHGDYHIGNVLFHDDGRLSAILDWELASLGDPLLDLGRLLAAWPEPDGSGPLSLKVEPWQGFPDRDELIARYAAGSGRSLAGLLWYEVLACYKLGIILEGTHARACAGLAEVATGDRLHRSAVALIERAHHWLEERG